jgi:superfamily I DNA/RNA helicase
VSRRYRNSGVALQPEPHNPRLPPPRPSDVHDASTPRLRRSSIIGSRFHTPEEGWGHWIQSIEVDEAFAGFTDELSSVIGELDTVVEADSDLPRFLGQIGLLGSDLAAASAGGVRFMSMTKSKGLTVDATVVIACEDNVVPRPDCSLDEERRLLFVAMTRSRRFLYCTWARRRTGPTARAGLPRVQERRSVSSFLVGGPVQSQDGTRHLRDRWVQP